MILTGVIETVGKDHCIKEIGAIDSTFSMAFVFLLKGPLELTKQISLKWPKLPLLILSY